MVIEGSANSDPMNIESEVLELILEQGEEKNVINRLTKLYADLVSEEAACSVIENKKSPKEIRENEYLQLTPTTYYHKLLASRFPIEGTPYSKTKYHSKVQYQSGDHQYQSNLSKDQYQSYQSKDQYQANQSKDQYQSNQSKDQYQSNQSKDQYQSDQSKDQYQSDQSKDQYQSKISYLSEDHQYHSTEHSLDPIRGQRQTIDKDEEAEDQSDYEYQSDDQFQCPSAPQPGGESTVDLLDGMSQISYRQTTYTMTMTETLELRKIARYFLKKNLGCKNLHSYNLTGVRRSDPKESIRRVPNDVLAHIFEKAKEKIRLDVTMRDVRNQVRTVLQYSYQSYVIREQKRAEEARERRPGRQCKDDEFVKWN